MAVVRKVDDAQRQQETQALQHEHDGHLGEAEDSNVNLFI